MGAYRIYARNEPDAHLALFVRAKHNEEGKIMFRNIMTVAVLTVSASLAAVTPALAVPPSPLPGPGVVGLVAFGVIGAIALAKSRK